jgi:N-acetylmuramoyl-L-alanine amidase CwlA
MGKMRMKYRRKNNILERIIKWTWKRERIFRLAAALVIIVIMVFVGYQMFRPKAEPMTEPVFEVMLLTPNPYSRPQTALEQINGIVIHYVANPGTTALQNRNYFEGLKAGHGPKVSSHFIIGLEGEIIQCIPTAEIAYASNHRNADTISIEVCHPDEGGVFTDATYASLLHLTAWLCDRFDLKPKDVIRHYDVNGKVCPLYYVEHPEAWEAFLQDLSYYIKTNHN